MKRHIHKWTDNRVAEAAEVVSGTNQNYLHHQKQHHQNRPCNPPLLGSLVWAHYRMGYQVEKYLGRLCWADPSPPISLWTPHQLVYKVFQNIDKGPKIKLHPYNTAYDTYDSHFWPPVFCYISAWSLLYIPKSLLYTPISFFISSTVPVMYVVGFPYTVSDLYTTTACTQCTDEGGGRGRVGGKNSYVIVRKILLWRAVYCVKPRPDPKLQSVSWSFRGLGRRALRIIQEYDLVNTIDIQPLTQPCMGEMGYSSFSSMSWLKVTGKTRASSPLVNY